MFTWLPRFIDSLAPATSAREDSPLHSVGLALVTGVFVLLSTLIVAFDSFAPFDANDPLLRVGGLAPRDIRAPFNITYESVVLTERRRQDAANAVSTVYDPPDPNVARQQIALLQQILDYIDNIRRDPYGSSAQKRGDITAITALRLNETVIDNMLQLDDETWRAATAEAIIVLERVMREAIREPDLALVIDQLPSQVALRFDARTASVIVGLVKDLLRANRFANPAATESAQLAASAATAPESRSFERGQILITEGTPIDAVAFEALRELGLLESTDRRAQDIAQAALASIIVLIGAGLYLARDSAQVYARARFIALLAGMFLFTLLGARVFSAEPGLYVFPTAALALLLVILTQVEIAIICAVGLGLLVGLIANGSLEIATLVSAGGVVGALILRRTERLNSYMIAGLVIALINIVVVALFNFGLLIEGGNGTTLGTLLLFGAINGVIAAMTALLGMYGISYLFNLPTSLRLVDLSQPNQPLLQRLLREAPGTYQHSLQVANLSEQAANAIGANAELVRVAALYHDVGKMVNAAFFVENQAENVNPHDVLNDPYRSADIIISHAPDGVTLARQYRLPVRLRDFILEHHGTTRVAYFYAQAVEQAGDEESVDAEQFTYHGPKPQTRETAILMLADSCESAVRARKPTNRTQIAEVVDGIINARMRDGQLDESNMTMRDIKLTRAIFVEMLQAVFHPRINYPTPEETTKRTAEIAPEAKSAPEPVDAEARAQVSSQELPALALDDEDDEPLSEVPPLRRTQRMNALPVQPPEDNGDTANGAAADEERP